MNGTRGHAAADFSHRVDPAGDAAENKANVTPVADFLSHEAYERLVERVTVELPRYRPTPSYRP